MIRIAASRENGSGDRVAVWSAFISKDLQPLGKRQVGGDHGRTALIALGQQIKQQFIDDQKSDFLIALLQRGQPLFVSGATIGQREVIVISGLPGLDDKVSHSMRHLRWRRRCGPERENLAPNQIKKKLLASP